MNDMENVQFATENNLLIRAASNCMQKWIKVNWRTAHEQWNNAQKKASISMWNWIRDENEVFNQIPWLRLAH